MVGPSGAGKDALIAGARRILSGDDRFDFPRREVTRPPGLPGEDYLAVSPEEFERREVVGGYCLSWRAHGLAYGVPCEVREHVAAGRRAVVNGSRTVVEHARRDFSRVRVLHVTAPPELLAARLQQRGREDAEAIRRRLDRAVALSGADVVDFVNDRPLPLAVEAFVQRLKE